LTRSDSAAIEIKSEDIDRAAARLARYVGPTAGVLAKRTARRSADLRAFYLLLAEHVESKADRARFLREAGFAERE